MTNIELDDAIIIEENCATRLYYTHTQTQGNKSCELIEHAVCFSLIITSSRGTSGARQ